MRKILFLFLLVLFIKILPAQEAKYFDVDNNEISSADFKEKRATNSVLDIPGKEINSHKLIKRNENGKINDIKTLISKLEQASKNKLNLNKPLVLIYYPGKDLCNSTGNRNHLLKKRIPKSQLLYIYKDSVGLDMLVSKIKWVKDPEQIIEKMFFKYHYPCGSFVVISKKAEYISYFGEYPDSYIIKAVKDLR